ncbi:hypothetical protein GCM10011428_15850 [Streptomyces violaceus]
MWCMCVLAEGPFDGRAVIGDLTDRGSGAPTGDIRPRTGTDPADRRGSGRPPCVRWHTAPVQRLVGEDRRNER